MLYVVTDDLDSELVEKYMPNTKALIRDAGAEFTNFYISESQCCPSRASALLGEYPHNTKVQQNDEPQGGEARFRAEGQESRTIANEMGSRGHATALFGKYLNGYDEARIPAGWDRWFAKHDQKFFDYDVTDQGRVEHFGTQPQAYSDEVVMKKARAHIRDVAEPWFVYLAPTGPHAPYDDPPGYGNVTGTPNRPPSYNERDVSDKPGYIHNQPSINGRAADAIRKNHVHRARKAAQIDDRIKDQIGALAARGELGNTYVIFTSDNGWMEGEHRRPSSKAVPYEESTRLPLFVRGPGIAPRIKVDALASNIDFFATFTDMQGDEQARDGRSLLPLATGEVSGSD